jgi:hypothetical protein
MIESRPIEIAFDAKQKVTGLEIITGLDAPPMSSVMPP